MRMFSEQVFDKTISGTSGVWYTPAEYNDLLGAPDLLSIFATVDDVTGTSPTLTLQIEHSANGEKWGGANTIFSAESLATHQHQGDYQNWLSLVRFRLTLGGTNPQCRLRIYVTGRSQ